MASEAQIRANRENAKKAGRKPGQSTAKAKEKAAVLAAMKERIARSADALLNAQMKLAQGCSYLYCIEKDGEGKKMKPRLVTEQEEIEDYLAGEFENSQDYYFITTEKPDNKAIDSMFDRTFGKAKESHDITTGGEKITALVKFLDGNSNN